MSAWVIADLSKQRALNLVRRRREPSSVPQKGNFLSFFLLLQIPWHPWRKWHEQSSNWMQHLLSSHKGTWEEALVCTVLAWACSSLGPVLCLAFNLAILPCSFWIKPGLVGARGCFNNQCEQSQEFTSIFKPISWSHWKSVLGNRAWVWNFGFLWNLLKSFPIYSVIWK